MRGHYCPYLGVFFLFSFLLLALRLEQRRSLSLVHLGTSQQGDLEQSLSITYLIVEPSAASSESMENLLALLVVGVTSQHVLRAPVVEHGSLVVTCCGLSKYDVTRLDLGSYQ